MVIIDNGHGENTAGKRSPKGLLAEDVALYEYEFNRDQTERLIRLLDAENIEFWELVPELHDVSLSERCRRVNEIHKKHKNAFLISIHGNAGGGTGWEIFTSEGETLSDQIATVFFEEAYKMWPKWKMRGDYSDGDPDKESQFYILKHTTCPAVLTENGFYDNEEDLKFMISDEGRQQIAEMHLKAIKRVLDEIIC